VASARLGREYRVGPAIVRMIDAYKGRWCITHIGIG
jgi:hypothetical protein